MTVAGCYYDGRTSRKQSVTVAIENGVVHMRGDALRDCPLREMEVSDRSVHAPRKLAFPDGAFIEFNDGPAIDAMLATAGHQDGIAVRLTQSWRNALMALVTTAAILVGSYVFLLPAAARMMAQALPASVEHTLGAGILSFLDEHLLEPTALPLERQRALTQAFKGLRAPAEDAPEFRLLFRSGKLGPNALALPSGEIVITDDMVKLAANDDEVMAVLAHELGHLHERHLTQRLIQTSAVAAASTLIFSDASALVSNLPTLMLDLKYSRDVETSADDYAVAMMKANGLPADALAVLFERLDEKIDGVEVPYLATHPVTSERVARIREISRN